MSLKRKPTALFKLLDSGFTSLWDTGFFKINLDKMYDLIYRGIYVLFNIKRGDKKTFCSVFSNTTLWVINGLSESVHSFF